MDKNKKIIQHRKLNLSKIRLKENFSNKSNKIKQFVKLKQ
jgi:hypothetical protein